MKRNFSFAAAAFFCSFVFFFASCENPLFIDAAKIYLVTFESNGGTPVEPCRTDKIPVAPITQKDGAEFCGWHANALFAGGAVTFPFEPSADVTLYAKWKQKYQVDFVTNGGTEVASCITDVVESAPATTKEGFVFAGWHKSADFSGGSVKFPYKVEAATTLYAKWLESGDTPYKVEHYKQSGSYVLADTDYCWGTTNSLTKAAAKNYEGFCAQSFSQGAIAADGSTVVRIYYDKIIVAVSFDANGGSGSMDAQEFFYGEPQALKANRFEKAEHTFLGWSTSSGGELVYTDKQIVSLKEPLILYAKWFYGAVVTAATIPDLDLSSITADYKIVVEGSISNSTLQALAEKIQAASMPITLDLSNATDISELHGPASGNDSVFSKCRKLEKLILPAGLKTIGSRAFQHCLFSSVIIPDSVTSIGSCAFFGCGNLNDIDFGNGLQSIGEDAFRQSGLTSVVFPKSLTAIQPTAFFGLSLASAIFLDDKTWTVTNMDAYLASRGYKYNISVESPGLNAVRLTKDYGLYIWSKN